MLNRLKVELKTATVTVDGEEVIIRELTGRERMKLAEGMDKTEERFIFILTTCIVGPETLTKPQAVDLVDKAFDFAQELVTEILEISGLTEKAEEEVAKK